MKRNRFGKVILFCLTIILLLPIGIGAEAGNQTGDIVIYCTNDIHGAVAFSDGGSIGLDRVAAMKEQTENAILVDAGDATQGLPFASLTQGADVIRVMNAAGYDAMAVGNREFDYGTERLLSNAEIAEFPVLAANVYRDGSALLAGETHDGCHVIIEKAGKKIGFFGLTTADTSTSTNPVGIVGVEFTNEIEAAKREIDELTAEGADAIIAIAHLGEYDNVPCDSAALALAMDGAYSGRLDAIIDGHSHTIESESVNDVYIIQTGTGLVNLGKLTLRFGDDDILDAVEGELLSHEDVVAMVEPDPEVAAEIEGITAGMMELLRVPVAQSETAFWGGTIDGVAEARVVETNFGSFAADAYRDAALQFIAHAPDMDEYQGLPVIGAENGGGIRASLPGGTITKGDLVNVFPFSNTLMIKQITPQILFETLEISVSGISGQDTETGLLSGEANGGFLQVSGICFTYDPAAPVGSKVQEVVLEKDGTKLDRDDSETKLMLVANNFIMSGGSGHAVLAELPLIGEIGGELETVEAYLIQQANGQVLPHQAVCSRIIPVGGYVPADYKAVVIIKDADGNPIADVPVSYSVDGGEQQYGQTDSKGRLQISVPDGPHSVKLAGSQEEVYINNYSGAGTVETEYRAFPSLTLTQADETEAWIVSDLMGSMTARTTVSPKDDFHAYVNREWLSSAELPEGYVNFNTFVDRELEVQEQIKALLTDDSSSSHEAQLVQNLYAQYTDMDARNALGMAPLKIRIDEILSIETLEDVTNYILNHEQNMCDAFFYSMIGADYADSSKQCLWISAPVFSLENADEYRQMSDVGMLMKEACDKLNIGLLTHAGMAEEDARRIISDAFAFETMIAQASMGVEATLEDDYLDAIYNPVSSAELEALSPCYPITGILRTYIDAGVDSFILSEPNWLARMNELYTEDNVELMKAYLICDTATYMADILDQTCLDLLDDWTSTVYGIEIVTDIEDAAYSYCSVMLDMLVGRMYADAYVTAQTKADVEAMVADIVAVYRSRLEACDWLSEETKQMAIRKLDKLKIRVAYPDDWSRYEAAELSFAGSEEGGDLVGSICAAQRFFRQHTIERLITPSDGGWWITTPQTVNAFYDASDNSINIPAGILGGVYYDPDASDEANMGGIGLIIAHEITHAFDDFGSQFDENGNYVNWWTDADAEAFYTRLDAVASYFDRIEVLPGQSVNGELVVGEAVADLGAMSCMLEIAKESNGFDYRKFFESYAAMWRMMETEEGLMQRLQTNTHPPHYLRTNAIVQQFEEFHKAYDIVEGDGMYLAPEKRLSVW